MEYLLLFLLNVLPSENKDYYYYFIIILSLQTEQTLSDELQQHVAFHLGLQCLPKYPFRVFQSTKG